MNYIHIHAYKTYISVFHGSEWKSIQRHTAGKELQSGNLFEYLSNRFLGMESGTKPKMNPGNEWYYGKDAAGVARPIYRLAGWTEQMAEAKLKRDADEAERDAQRKAVQLEQQRAFQLEQ